MKLKQELFIWFKWLIKLSYDKLIIHSHKKYEPLTTHISEFNCLVTFFYTKLGE